MNGTEKFISECGKVKKVCGMGEILLEYHGYPPEVRHEWENKVCALANEDTKIIHSWEGGKIKYWRKIIDNLKK